MANLRKWLEAFEQDTGETVEAVVVGVHYRREYAFDGTENPLPDENVVLSREAALAKVDQEYDHGYGGADCYPVYAWTPSWVWFVHEYDGATGPRRVPRNPVPCAPEFGGGL